jgi:RNA polymerase sigma-70 factor (ECF subfamily)
VDVTADPPGDRDLVAKVIAGERAALATLYARHGSWLILRLSRRCADPGLVDEVVQDTFLAVWRAASRYNGTGEVAAWIWGIAIRRLVDRLRVRAPRMAPMSEVRRVYPSAEEQVLLAVEYGDLGGALRRLPAELRAVVEATILDGLTTKEAARLLGIPNGTVKTRLMRARAALREVLA